MFIKEIGLHAQNTITILSSIINIVGSDLYESTKIFTLTMHKMLIRAPDVMTKVVTASTWIC